MFLKCALEPLIKHHSPSYSADAKNEWRYKAWTRKHLVPLHVDNIDRVSQMYSDAITKTIKLLSSIILRQNGQHCRFLFGVHILSRDEISRMSSFLISLRFCGNFKGQCLRNGLRLFCPRASQIPIH